MSIDAFAPDVDIEAELANDLANEPAEEPIVPAAEEPVAEIKAVEEPKAEERPEKMVSLNALHESRMKEREARARADQIEREAAERFKKLEERLEKLANPPPAVPKFEDDPANHLRHQVDAVRQEFAPIKEQMAANAEQSKQAEVERQIAGFVASSENEFVAVQPDYLDAVAHLQKVADSNLLALGITDPQQRVAMIRRDAMQMAVNAARAGKSPAELAYTMAKNYGYTPKSAQSDVKTAESKIDSIAKGKASTPSMPAGGKVAPTMSLAALEALDDDEFNKMIDDPAAWKKLMRDAK